MMGLSPAVDAGFLPTPERFMNRHSLAIYAALLTGLSGLAACGVAPSLPQATPMTARLSGAGEVPPFAGTGSAAAEARLVCGQLVAGAVPGARCPVPGEHELLLAWRLDDQPGRAQGDIRLVIAAGR